MEGSGDLHSKDKTVGSTEADPAPLQGTKSAAEAPQLKGHCARAQGCMCDTGVFPHLPTRCLLSLQAAALAGRIQPETDHIPPLPLAAVQNAINTDLRPQLANNSMSHSYWGRTAGDRERDGGGAASSATCLRQLMDGRA